MRTPNYDKWLNDYAKSGWNATISIVDQAVKSLLMDIAAHEERLPAQPKDTPTCKFDPAIGPCCKLPAEQPPAHPAMPRLEAVQRWVPDFSRGTLDKLSCGAWMDGKEAIEAARSDLAEAKAGMVNAYERILADFKERISELEVQLAHATRDKDTALDDNDRLRTQLRTIDTAAGTWSPNQPTDVNAIVAKLASQGKRAKIGPCEINDLYARIAVLEKQVIGAVRTLIQLAEEAKQRKTT
jgi:hypothetical protein